MEDVFINPVKTGGKLKSFASKMILNEKLSASERNLFLILSQIGMVLSSIAEDENNKPDGREARYHTFCCYKRLIAHNNGIMNQMDRHRLAENDFFWTKVSQFIAARCTDLCKEDDSDESIRPWSEERMLSYLIDPRCGKKKKVRLLSHRDYENDPLFTRDGAFWREEEEEENDLDDFCTQHSLNSFTGEESKENRAVNVVHTGKFGGKTAAKMAAAAEAEAETEQENFDSGVDLDSKRGHLPIVYRKRWLIEVVNNVNHALTKGSSSEHNVFRLIPKNFADLSRGDQRTIIDRVFYGSNGHLGATKDESYSCDFNFFATRMLNFGIEVRAFNNPELKWRAKAKDVIIVKLV